MKRNLSGKLLQLSQLLEGRKTFVIFPSGSNDSGSTTIFEAIKSIIGTVVALMGPHFPASFPMLGAAFCVAFSSTAATWLLSSVWLNSKLAAFFRSFAASVSTSAHLASPSSSPATSASLEGTLSAPTYRLLSGGGSKILDLFGASKGCSPPPP